MVATTIGIGVYTPGAPGDMGRVRLIERLLGCRMSTVAWYQHWAGPWSEFRREDFEAVLEHGARPMLTWMADDPTAPGYPSPDGQRAYTCRAVAEGTHDAHVRSWAAGLRDLGSRVLLRLDHEMNGRWYAWSPGINGNTAADFVAMWRHVHAVFLAEGATAVDWVWSPNVDYPGASQLLDCYPGDDVVDWIGVDGYNWGDDDAGHRWQSFADVFRPTYRALTAIPGKPLMIAETGCAEAPPGSAVSKAEWVTTALRLAPVEFPRVRALVWFDERDGACDFRLASSDASLAALATALDG